MTACDIISPERISFQVPSTTKVINPPDEEKPLPCGTCGRETSHKILTAVKEDGRTPDDDIQYWVRHWTVQCLGCKTVSFCSETRTSEDLDDDGTLVPTTKPFPSVLLGLKKLEYQGSIPYRKIYRVYDETYAALCEGLNILPGIGIRAVVEAVCTDQKVAKGNLQTKIDGLATAGVITKNDAS
jgi:hypothetical protein